MKKQVILAIVTFWAAAPSVQAVDLTGNVGWNSDYVFRGVSQDRSSANAGLDVEHEGFYAGTWFASVDPGLEYDIYGGYNGEVGEFTYGVGATGYFYTDDFDDTYLEINLNGGWEFLSVEAAIGQYDNFNGPTLDYVYLAGTAEYQNLYATVGGFTRDLEGIYLEAGYGDTLTVADTDLFDWTVSIIFRGDDLPTDGSEDDTYLNLGITKSFAIKLPK